MFKSTNKYQQIVASAFADPDKWEAIERGDNPAPTEHPPVAFYPGETFVVVVFKGNVQLVPQAKSWRACHSEHTPVYSCPMTERMHALYADILIRMNNIKE